MKLVSTILLSKKDHASQLEEEKLDRLCLTVDEKNFIENMIDLLSPFEIVTHRIYGAKYPILNLVYLYIEEISDTDDSSSVSEDENISSADLLDKAQYIPNEIVLIVSVLDPRMKSLRFAINIQQTNTKLKLYQSQTSNTNSFSKNDNLDYDNFFAEVFNLEGTNNTIIESDDDEVSQYFRYSEAKPKKNFLVW
ncbi:6874_t:CDS:2 [Scutellospora calospora]|uniref:6874_t:CDS:1 n=1 Tax=Scutellospora calospora TaxID=85575 RepID=A0ACA9L776_9GLOM|nr:6874_t:CDS:2 [Scutellospora calospora]